MEQVPLRGEGGDDVGVHVISEHAQQLARIVVPRPIQEADAPQVLPRHFRLGRMLDHKLGVATSDPPVRHLLHGD
eukprot:CAMPEP_0170429064 /NCGR_PEP_ID=MMETSP0117_2-20130122/40105_1 /TAXON_ID=400756 /ORGANISM="Durinskia baltica, Strain CSIRO CS-38" /LENGTH=74 /DNA_ID=CAMNT_0010688401 /DNA_START=1 /DNA_END=223 /DNA_ORIENTATION=-